MRVLVYWYNECYFTDKTASMNGRLIAIPSVFQVASATGAVFCTIQLLQFPISFGSYLITIVEFLDLKSPADIKRNEIKFSLQWMFKKRLEEYFKDVTHFIAKMPPSSAVMESAGQRLLL